jgi:DNA-binding NarL/FixJ family response regulator
LDRVRVLLADDNEDFLAATARLLESECEVVATVRDGETLIKEAARLEPEVLVLDISMPGLSGIAAAQYLRETGCTAKIVFLTANGDPDYVRAALEAGAQGYVVKCRLVSDLLLAVREALKGGSFISPSLSLEQIRQDVSGGRGEARQEKA